MKIALYTVILSVLSNVFVMASPSTEVDTVENGVSKRAEENKALCGPWCLALYVVLVTAEIAVQKIAQAIAANKATAQYSDTENITLENPRDVSIPEQAKRLANKLARDNVTGSPNNNTGVVIAPRGYIQDVYATPYDWFSLTLERNNKKPKEFELFVSNSGHILLNTVPNVAGDVVYYAGSAHAQPSFSGTVLPGVKNILMNVTFGEDSNGYWHTYKV